MLLIPRKGMYLESNQFIDLLSHTIIQINALLLEILLTSFAFPFPKD